MKTSTRRYRGLTVIEIALVIAVLLGLISILFIGISSYKEGLARAEAQKKAADAPKQEQVQTP
jgi:Tfp pilus assembly protein PilE